MADSPIREYWTSGDGFRGISWVPKVAEKEPKEETMKSGNHFQAKKSKDGEWTCDTCGGESMDFELFEEFGDINGCLLKGIGKDGSAGNPKTLLENVDVQRARKHIENMKKAMRDVGEAAEKVTYEIKNGLGEVITTFEEPPPTPFSTSRGGMITYFDDKKVVAREIDEKSYVTVNDEAYRGEINEKVLKDVTEKKKNKAALQDMIAKKYGMTVTNNLTIDPSATRMAIKQGSWLSKALKRGSS